MSRQKRKGDGYERELAKWLDDQLYGGGGQIQRAMLSGGGRNLEAGEWQTSSEHHIWVEAKRTEKFKPYEAIEQAETGIDKSNSRDIPVVMQRRNQMKTEDSLVVMRLEDWTVLYRCFLATGHETIDPHDEDIIEFTPEEDDLSLKDRLLSSNLKLVVNNNGQKKRGKS